MIKLINADYCQVLRSHNPVRMIFADPPDAIGMKYDGFKDKFSNNDYRDFLRHVIFQGTQACDIF